MSVRYVDQRRAAKRLSWVLLFAIGVAMTVSLYYVKTRAQNAKNDVRQLERSIAQETAAIKVLEAELAFLSGPERLSDLSAKALGLAPIVPEQTRDLSDISELFPLREVVAEGENVEAAQ
ncbi:hypothetical protein ACJ3XI_06645 [Litorimonas sp. RW-G-Af-16]|uniref:cell division protein FtsL n=1 Tax=Litorimonas sp. RW-G-Af-16 TaxID=3241168 RepID=UPI00390C538F